MKRAKGELVPMGWKDVGTMAAVAAAGLTVASVIFSAGDARQMQKGDHAVLGAHDGRITKLEGDVSDIRATLARIDQATSDTKDTVHRLERGHVHRVAEE